MASLQSTRQWRAGLVAAYHRCNNYSQVAREHNTDRKVVKKWVERFEQEGGVEDAYRIGRPPSQLWSQAATGVINKGVDEEKCCRQIAQDLKKEAGVDVSPESVRRHLKHHVARPLVIKKKPEAQSYPLSTSRPG